MATTCIMRYLCETCPTPTTCRLKAATQIQQLRAAAERAVEIIDKLPYTQREGVADASQILRDALDR